MTNAESLARRGTATLPSGLEEGLLARVSDTLDAALAGGPGARGLLRDGTVREAADELRHRLTAAGWLREGAPAVQAIAFNKTPGANWKVAWHQDRQFPFSERVEAEGCTGWSRKDGTDYAEPPRSVLEGLLAVRLHLDPCGPENGPLRVLPGSHREGVLDDASTHHRQQEAAEETLCAELGDVILMRPLLLHASSASSRPVNRRVLHFVFAEAPLPAPARWQTEA